MAFHLWTGAASVSAVKKSVPVVPAEAVCKLKYLIAGLIMVSWSKQCEPAAAVAS